MGSGPPLERKNEAHENKENQGMWCIASGQYVFEDHRIIESQVSVPHLSEVSIFPFM